MGLLAVVSSGACGPRESPRETAGTPAGPTPGPLVVIGGGLSQENEAVYSAILDRRQGEGPLCVLPTAAGDPAASGASAVERFDRYGGEGTALLLDFPADDLEAGSDPARVALLESCSGFFFVGGQQSRVTRVFGTHDVPTAGLTTLLRRYGEGAVIAGSSAGAAIMSEPMINGGTSEGALTGGVVRDGNGEGPGVRLQGGFRLIEGVLLDQHFLARGRIGRLVVAVLDSLTADRGFGVDENTALVVEDGFGTVVGASGAVLVDAGSHGGNGAAGSPAQGGSVSTRTVAVHLLGEGDRYHFGRREIVPAGDKQPLEGGGSPPDSGADVFSRWAFLNLLVDLSGSAENSVEVSGDGYRWVIRKGPGFSAVRRSGEGVEGTPAGFGAGPFLVDLLGEADR